MSYKFITPCCVQKLRVDKGLEGRKLECPFCTSPFYIPADTKNKNKMTKLVTLLGMILIIAAAAIYMARDHKTYKKANQLHLIATQEKHILIDALTLKMEQSEFAKNALAYFHKGEDHFHKEEYMEAIHNFKSAIAQLTKAQIIHSEIKSKVQPEITQLKKRIKGHEKFLIDIQLIENHKNNLKPREALKLINKLKIKLNKSSLEPSQKPEEKPLKKTSKVLKTKVTEKKEETEAINNTAKVSSTIIPVDTAQTSAKLKYEKPPKVETKNSPKVETKEIRFSDQESYYGETINDIPNGQGRYTFSNGNLYEGTWLKGSFHGQGIYTFINGDHFEGHWNNGKRHGIGIYQWKNQSTLKAMWEEGTLMGKAFLSMPKQRKQALYFEHGNIKGSNKNYSFNSPNLNENKFRLNRKQQRIYNFTKKVQLASNRLSLNDSKLLVPDPPMHELIYARYFAGLMSEREMLNIEAQIKQDFFARKRYFLQSNKALSPEEENDAIVGELDGYSIPTAKLGVVLDASGSMLKYIKPLKEQISDQFPTAAFIEVDSCRLTTFTKGKISEKAADDSTMNAIKYLIDNKGVDSIYWFSDLNGAREPETMKQLSQWLDESLVSLYVRSVGKKPDEQLMQLITISGGKYLKK